MSVPVVDASVAVDWLPDDGLDAIGHRISFQCSLYLELALRHHATLASLDADLIQAGIAEGLSLVGN